MRSFTLPLLAAAVVVPVLMASQAQAASYYANVITNPTGGSLPVSGLQFTVDKYNTSLGTLLSVDAYLDGTYSNGAIKFNNSSDDPASYSNAKLNILATAAFPAGFDVYLTIAGDSGPYAGSVPAHTTSPSLSDISGLTGSGSTSQNTTSNLGNYEAFPGTFNVDLTATGVLSGTFNTPLFTGSAADAFANLHVRYNYEPVPEPASLGMLGLGAMGLMIRRRR